MTGFHFDLIAAALLAPIGALWWWLERGDRQDRSDGWHVEPHTVGEPRKLYDWEQEGRL